jgi:hypothetical protein
MACGTAYGIIRYSRPFPAGLLDEIVPRDGLRLIGWDWPSFGPVRVLNSVPLVVLLIVYMPLTRED